LTGPFTCISSFDEPFTEQIARAQGTNMSEQTTIWERLSNRLYAIPEVAQWWAKFAARRADDWRDPNAAIPFTRLQKPLAQCSVALVTTAGVHLPSQDGFDMENGDGDASYRPIPMHAEQADLTITHKYYDHRDADADLNVVFPLAHLRDLVQRGVLGSLAKNHYGFMGHIEGPQVAILTERSAPEVAAKLRADNVDFALLTPA
jgi:D-proline reductase (dithiol) PrdB